MKRNEFNKYLSHLMFYAWSIKRGSKKQISIGKAMTYTWKIANDERNNKTLPLITYHWTTAKLK
jgi:hypothetical protein